MATLLESRDEYIAEVKRSERPFVVVDFFATWCKPCEGFKLTFDIVAEQFPKVRFVKMDVERLYGGEVRAMGIDTIPTTAIFRNGSIATKLVGNVSEEELAKFVSDYMEQLAEEDDD